MSDGQATLPETPSYGGTIFISYARADDEKFPLDPDAKGWVEHFWEVLRWALTNEGVHQATLWRDRYQIEPAEDFTEKIEQALAEAHMIVPVLSPNWVQRPWCQREVLRFCELHAGANDDIVLVVKRDPPPEAVPEPLRNREGYRFFAKDPSGKLRDFYWGGLVERDAYLAQIRRMAEWIAARLLQNRHPPPPSPPAKNRTVFVAVAADELRDARQKLVNDLIKDGYTVVPASDRLPDTAALAEAEIKAALAEAELVVHVLGDAEGYMPAGGEKPEPILPLQLRLARERGVLLPRVLWAPKWLPGRPDSKRDPFAVVASYGGRLPGEEVYGEGVTDLSQWLRARLEPKPVPTAAATGSPVVLIASAAEVDDALALDLAGRLQLPEVDVQPLRAGDPAASDGGRPVVLVPWGAAETTALDARVGVLQPVASTVSVLRLPGGDEAAKIGFFKKGVYVAKLDALPEDRKAARELLKRLEVLEADA